MKLFGIKLDAFQPLNLLLFSFPVQSNGSAAQVCRHHLPSFDLTSNRTLQACLEHYAHRDGLMNDVVHSLNTQLVSINSQKGGTSFLGVFNEDPTGVSDPHVKEWTPEVELMFQSIRRFALGQQPQQGQRLQSTLDLTVCFRLASGQFTGP